MASDRQFDGHLQIAMCVIFAALAVFMACRKLWGSTSVLPSVPFLVACVGGVAASVGLAIYALRLATRLRQQDGSHVQAEWRWYAAAFMTGGALGLLLGLIHPSAFVLSGMLVALGLAHLLRGASASREPTRLVSSPAPTAVAVAAVFLAALTIVIAVMCGGAWWACMAYASSVLCLTVLSTLFLRR